MIYLTLSLYFEYTDGVLGVERAELAGGERVPALTAGGDRSSHVDGLQERQCAHH